MKKFKIWLATLLTVCLAICCFVACGGNKYAGTYKFQSMTMVMGGVTVEIKANEPIQGITLNDDFCYMTLEEDGTAKLVMTGAPALNMAGQEATGTWEEGDKADTVVITFEGDSEEIVIKDGVLTIAQSEGEMSMSLVLAKAE